MNDYRQQKAISQILIMTIDMKIITLTKVLFPVLHVLGGLNEAFSPL